MYSFSLSFYLHTCIEENGTGCMHIQFLRACFATWLNTTNHWSTSLLQKALSVSMQALPHDQRMGAFEEDIILSEGRLEKTVYYPTSESTSSTSVHMQIVVALAAFAGIFVALVSVGVWMIQR